MNCGCTDDNLCPVAKELWKLKGSEGRGKYNAHRNLALNYDPDNPRGHFQKIEGLSFWANNGKK
jgi:hypothetical protein